MKFRVDLAQELKKQKDIPAHNAFLQELENIWKKSHETDISILDRLQQKVTDNTPGNHFDVNALNPDHIYHINDIKKICITYRLRFLSTHYFKGDYPVEAISKIKDLERKHETAFFNFKVIAPSSLFKLKNADDPLLFIPIENDYYYFVHKWGNDVHPLRKIWAWFFKSFENTLLLCFFTSLVITLLIPEGMFSPAQNPSIGFFIELLFMFKSVVAVVLYYGFAKGKNFNTAIWNSKYYN
ncbi:hypothetical protein [Aquimarina agarilytica]|uniref:hypothetical protein n=1 Tax=Aquimarina agarilytica TaxID=1087449 RepID=UPI0002885C52|nr:hypothetical protein [Aquimarina agarilytica]